MIENVTLGQVASVLAFVIALGGSITGIVALVKKPFKKRDEELKKYIALVIKEEVEPLKTSVNRIETDLQKVDMQACKNYLVTFLSDVEQGGYIDEIETQRFWEQFEHYDRLGGNGFIHQKVEKLKAKNLI